MTPQHRAIWVRTAIVWTLAVGLLLSWVGTRQRAVEAQQQPPSTSVTADARFWGKNADGVWVPVVLDSSGNMPVSANGGIGVTAGPQLPPSTSVTTDARLWGQNGDGFWVPIVLDSTGHLPTGATNPQGRSFTSGATCPPVATPDGGTGSLYTCTTDGSAFTWNGSAWVALGGSTGGGATTTVVIGATTCTYVNGLLTGCA